MNWKRPVVLAAALSLLAVACGDDDGSSDSATTAPLAATTAAPATTAGAATTAAPTGEKVSVAILLPCAINDASWCQAAYEGVKQLESEGLIDLQVVENAPFDAQGATRVMTGFAEDGVDLVIGHSFDY